MLMASNEFKKERIKTERRNIDNTLNHNQPISLYNKKQFYYNYKIDEYIFKKTHPNYVLSTDPKK